MSDVGFIEAEGADGENAKTQGGYCGKAEVQSGVYAGQGTEAQGCTCKKRQETIQGDTYESKGADTQVGDCCKGTRSESCRQEKAQIENCCHGRENSDSCDKDSIMGVCSSSALVGGVAQIDMTKDTDKHFEHKMIRRKDDEKKKLVAWINRIGGSINGIAGMISDDRYCYDILVQLAAVEKSIRSLSSKILEEHLKSCVTQRIESGNTEVIDEVVELFKRFQ